MEDSRPTAVSALGLPAVGAVLGVLDTKGSQEKAIELVREVERYISPRVVASLLVIGVSQQKSGEVYIPHRFYC